MKKILSVFSFSALLLVAISAGAAGTSGASEPGPNYLSWDNWGYSARMEAGGDTISGSVWEQCPYGKCNEAPIQFARKADGTWSGVFGQVAVSSSAYDKSDPTQLKFQMNTRPGGMVVYTAKIVDGNLAIHGQLKTGLAVSATLDKLLTGMRVDVRDRYVSETDVLTRVGATENFRYTSRVTDSRGSFYFDGRSTNRGTLSLENLRKDPALLAIMYALPYGNLMNPLRGMRK